MKPVFDPNAPYEETETEIPVFDPNAEYEDVEIDVAPPARPQWSELPGNIIPSGARVIRGVGDAVMNPIDTVTDTARGAYALATDPKARDEVKKALMERYGSTEALRNSFIKDPVGVTLELGGLGLGGVGAVKAAGPLVVKAGKKAGELAARAGEEAAGTVRSIGLPEVGATLRNNKPSPVAGIADDVPVGPAGLTKLSPEAKAFEDILYKDMVDAGWTPDQLTQVLKQLGPGARLADLEPFFGRAEAVAQLPKGARVAKKEIVRRKKGAKERLLNTVDNTLTDANYYGTLDELQAERALEAKPFREQAIADTLPIKSKKLRDHVIEGMRLPDFQSGLREGSRLADLEGWAEWKPVRKLDTWLEANTRNINDPNFRWTEKNMPSLEMIDAAKQGIDSAIAKFKDPTTGFINWTPEAVALRKANATLTDILRQSSGKYAAYLDKWGDYTGNMSAVESGAKIITKPEEIGAKMIAKMTESEKGHARIGLARAMKDRINANPQAAVRLLSEPHIRRKVKLLYGGDKEAYNAFRRSIWRESRFNESHNEQIKGSATSRRRSGKEGLEKEVSNIPAEAVGMTIDLATGNPITATRRTARILDRFRRSKDAPPIADEGAKVLWSPDPSTQARIIQRMRARSGVAGESGITDVAPGERIPEELIDAP